MSVKIGMVELGRCGFCQLRVSNPINHLYLPLPRNVLAIQETLGERGACLLFCYLTGLLMGLAVIHSGFVFFCAFVYFCISVFRLRGVPLVFLIM